MFRVLTLNNIAKVGLAQLPADRYQIDSDGADPHVILLRSASLHGRAIPRSLLAVGRAGAGVNNIPIPEYTAHNVAVFNTPGANANAVKELVMAGLIVACRQICQGWDFARRLEGTDEEIHKTVEAGKKDFAGIELPGRTLSVIGLGAIGRLVANAAVALGMRVVGFDPGLTEEGARHLANPVTRVTSLDDALASGEFVTMHVPLGQATRGLINASRLSAMKRGVIVLNFSREGIVDEPAMVAALDAGTARAYVSDFPTNLTKNHPKCITLPHLGASTAEAEDNCAVFAVQQIQDYLEHGNIRNSVNFPAVSARRGSAYRLTCLHDNVPNMLAQISEILGRAGVNIHDMVNSSRDALAYTLMDLDAPVSDEVFARVAAIPGLRRANRL